MCTGAIDFSSRHAVGCVVTSSHHIPILEPGYTGCSPAQPSCRAGSCLAHFIRRGGRLKWDSEVVYCLVVFVSLPTAAAMLFRKIRQVVRFAVFVFTGADPANALFRAIASAARYSKSVKCTGRFDFLREDRYRVWPPWNSPVGGTRSVNQP